MTHQNTQIIGRLGADPEMRYLAVSRRWLSDYGLAGRDVLGICQYDLFPQLPEAARAAQLLAAADIVSLHAHGGAGPEEEQEDYSGVRNHGSRSAISVGVVCISRFAIVPLVERKTGQNQGI